jgi:hypothetical protein
MVFIPFEQIEKLSRLTRTHLNYPLYFQINNKKMNTPLANIVYIVSIAKFYTKQIEVSWIHNEESKCTFYIN